MPLVCLKPKPPHFPKAGSHAALLRVLLAAWMALSSSCARADVLADPKPYIPPSKFPPSRDRTPREKYVEEVNEAVRKEWYRLVSLNKKSIKEGSIRVRCYIDKRGKPHEVIILADKSDADEFLRRITTQAILAADIPRIPAEVFPELEGGRLKFEYEAIVY